MFSIHKNTVLNWIKSGLPTIDNKRPMLILGSELAEFLKMRRIKNKQSCKPGELYCLRCRAPRSAAGNVADYLPYTEKAGNLVAICPVCDAVMNRRVSLGKIQEIRGNIDIKFPEDLKHIVNRGTPSLNCDLK